ncbi:NinG protein [Chryseobacterium sp. SN22]|uniref:recombination protein NinG n=1 Tax=Chryseobacterium sp. SN22 TaxID=2606431 RepID=UPI0011EC603A|nr:recombination protein NinG [Chryseobacterium sp. SN22]KAA0126469.1 NinG protein [Chryseobacterium sp. SN22]
MITDEIKNRYKGRSISWLEDRLQDLINAKIRRRDSVNGYFICISCQELKPAKQMNAGHYYPKEPLAYRAVKFDLDNIHGQCIRCNRHLSANLIPYRANLLQKIGERRLLQLEQKAALSGFKYSRDFLIEQIEKLKYERT